MSILSNKFEHKKCLRVDYENQYKFHVLDTVQLWQP